MKKRAAIIAAAAAVIIIAAAVIVYMGIGSQVRECQLYFLNQSGTSLIVEDRHVSCHDESDLPEAVLNQLIKGPESTRNMRVINRSAKVKSVTGDGAGNYTADFSADFYMDDSTKTIFSVYAVVKTLCSINGINSVKVTVDGQDFTSADGSIIDSLTSEDINLSIDTDTSETHDVLLYFFDPASNKLAPETRTIRITDQQPPEQYIINELIKGPEDNAHDPVLSSSTTLISVTISENIGFVNFAHNFIDKNTGSPEAEERAIFAIVNSMTELEGISKVQFLIEGKKAEKFGTISIEHPIGRNTDIIA